MLTLTQLLDQHGSVEEALEEGRQLVDGVVFDTTNWKAGSAELTLLYMWAYQRYQIGLVIQTIAQQYFNATSSGEALKELSRSHFDNEKNEGVKAVVRLELSCSVGNGPYSFEAGDLTVVYDNALKFFNVNTAPVFVTGSALNGVLVDFEAEDVGTEYNVNDLDNWSLQTNKNGVTAHGFDFGSGSALLVTGVSEEADATLKLRNATKWATLAAGGTVRLRMLHFAMTSTSGSVTDVNVDDQNPNGPGTVIVYCATALQPATEGDCDIVYNASYPSLFNGRNLLSVEPATANYFDRTIKITYKPGYDETYVSDTVKDTLDTWLTETPIGGRYDEALDDNIANVNDLVTMLESLDFVKRASVSGTDYVSLSTNEKLSKPVSGWVSPQLQLTGSTTG